MMSSQPSERPGWASVEAVAESVRGCTLCRLSEQRTNAVPGDGSSTASIMFIGEGPGEQEDRQGLPFVGRAGQLLNELLAGVPLARSDVYITNVVKCRPPGNRDPMPDEVAACWPYLDAQIAMIDPRVIVTLGRHSMVRFYPEGRITRDHGRIVPLGNRVLFPVFHPAAGLRNPEMKRALFEDFKRLPEAVLHGIAL
jgi:DNA polymerase